MTPKVLTCARLPLHFLFSDSYTYEQTPKPGKGHVGLEARGIAINDATTDGMTMVLLFFPCTLYVFDRSYVLFIAGTWRGQ